MGTPKRNLKPYLKTCRWLADGISTSRKAPRPVQEQEKPNWIRRELNCVRRKLYVELSVSLTFKRNVDFDEKLSVYVFHQEKLATNSRNLKALTTKSSFKERYKTAGTYLQKLKFLEDDVRTFSSLCII